jgi:hypothetical protein
MLIQSTPPHSTSWRSILILSSHPRLRLRNGLFHSDFPTKPLYTPLLSPIRATYPAHLILNFITRTVLCWVYRSFSALCCFHVYFLFVRVCMFVYLPVIVSGHLPSVLIFIPLTLCYLSCLFVCVFFLNQNIRYLDRELNPLYNTRYTDLTLHCWVSGLDSGKSP